MDDQTVVAYLNRVSVTAPTVSDAAGLRELHCWRRIGTTSASC